MNFYNNYLLLTYDRIYFFCRLFISHMLFFHRIAFFDSVRLISVFKFHVINIIKKIVPKFYLERIKVSVDEIINFCVSFFCCILSNYHIQNFFFNYGTFEPKCSFVKSCRIVYLDVFCYTFDSHKKADVC